MQRCDGMRLSQTPYLNGGKSESTHYSTSYISFTRSILGYREPLQEVKLHSFGDASKEGVCADFGVVQELVVARSRLAKTSLTKPRLELVAGHMAVNLAVNVRSALQGLNITKYIHCWLDSTVALHWLNDNGE